MCFECHEITGHKPDCPFEGIPGEDDIQGICEGCGEYIYAYHTILRWQGHITHGDRHCYAAMREANNELLQTTK